MKKNCSLFNANIMASYIEKKLPENELKKFENHLFKCDFCLKVYNNLKYEMNKISETEKLIEIPEFYFNKALEKLKISEKKKILSKIILKLYQKGMELLEVLNTIDYSTVPVPALRGVNNKKLLEEIRTKSEFKGVNYEICVKFYKKNRIKVNLKFIKIPESLKISSVSVSGADTDVIKNFSQEITFDNLNRGNYKIKINDTEIAELDIS